MKRPTLSTALLVLSLAAAAGAQQATPSQGPADDGPIIVQNSYWAKPGMEEEVYQHRLYASQVRASIGLPAGRVLRRISDSEHQPDVIWECEYPNETARAADVEALVASGALGPVMEKMETLIDHFDRAVWRVTESPAAPGGD